MKEHGREWRRRPKAQDQCDGRKTDPQARVPSLWPFPFDRGGQSERQREQPDIAGHLNQTGVTCVVHDHAGSRTETAEGQRKGERDQLPRRHRTGRVEFPTGLTPPTQPAEFRSRQDHDSGQPQPQSAGETPPDEALSRVRD